MDLNPGPYVCVGTFIQMDLKNKEIEVRESLAVDIVDYSLRSAKTFSYILPFNISISSYIFKFCVLCEFVNIGPLKLSKKYLLLKKFLQCE